MPLLRALIDNGVAATVVEGRINSQGMCILRAPLFVLSAWDPLIDNAEERVIGLSGHPL